MLLCQQSTECFRKDPATCLSPGHPYYEATHNGLDSMLRRVINELTLLSKGSDEDANYLNPRIDFLHQVKSTAHLVYGYLQCSHFVCGCLVHLSTSCTR